MKRILYFLLGVISICLLCVAGYAIFIWIQSLQPKLVWEPLFIDENAFPNGWTKGKVYNACVSAPLDSGCDNFKAKAIGFEDSSNDQNGAGEEIRFYDSKKDATQDFSDIQKMYFSPAPNTTPYITPAGLNHRSVLADQYHIACQEYKNAPVSLCFMIGQYNRFIVIFSWRGAEIAPGDLGQVLQAIDEKMKAYKDNPPFTK
jgi:hypothetical protein